MAFGKLVSLGSGLLLLGLCAVATGAHAHEDEYIVVKKHHRPRSVVYVVRERPEYYYSPPRVIYAPPPVAYYPPGPPSLNFSIPLR
jgi:hypothetical protein